jgi:hypothetical protein
VQTPHSPPPRVQAREVAGSAPPHAILSALTIQAYNETELKRSLEAEAREDSLQVTKFASGELNRADGVADRGLKSRGRVAIPLDPTGREDQRERQRCQAGSAISTRTHWAAAGGSVYAAR